MNDNFLCKDHILCCAHKFIKWGLSFFILGFILSLGVIIHYLTGSSWNVSDAFLSNVTLWFGSPLTLSTGYLQLGGLGMVAVGVAKLCAYKCCCAKCSTCCPSTDKATTDSSYQIANAHYRGSGSIALCVFGLLALLLTGFIGYFVIDAIYPGFYYLPIVAGKNWWLALQGISLLIFIIGVISAFCHVCKWCSASCKKCRSTSYNPNNKI